MLLTTISMEPEKFRSCYHYCTLTRNLQILGAFAYLSKVTGKKHFEQYIPAALRTLRTNLKAENHSEFPRLAGVVEEICGRFTEEAKIK
jgi:aminoglycoside/choline kinase family phosphotransferase